jgi:hypothetical protein
MDAVDADYLLLMNSIRPVMERALETGEARDIYVAVTVDAELSSWNCCWVQVRTLSHLFGQ